MFKTNRTTSYQIVSLIITVLLTIALLSGCSNLLTRTEGEGKVVLTLTRVTNARTLSSTYFSDTAGVQELHLAGFESGEVNPADLPRSVSQVLNNISGYLVRVEGTVFDKCSYYQFAEGQDQMTVNMTLPAGSSYTITLLALGGAADTNLLGAGQDTFSVNPGQTTTLPIPMLPYKYIVDYNQTFTRDTSVPVSFYLLGPLLEDIFALNDDKNRVFYSTIPPTENPGRETPENSYLSAVAAGQSNIEDYDCYQFQVQIPDNSTYFNISESGAGLSYQTYLQLELKTNLKWQELIEQAGLSEISLLGPDLDIDGGLEEVLVSPVENTNNAPEFYWLGEGNYSSIRTPERTGNEGWNLSFMVTAYDQDDDVLKFTASGELAQYFNESTRKFNWTPPDGSNGTYSIDFQVTDEELTDSQTVSIEIKDTIVPVTSGMMTTAAGSGEIGFSGDGGPAIYAEMDNPEGVAVDNSGNIYIADTQNSRIRKVDLSGEITTIAGTDTAGYSGDGGQAAYAQLSYPEGIAVDDSGNIYIADSSNHVIRKIDTGGIITTVAGNETAGFSGDGGEAVAASLYYPSSVAVDSAGNLYISDTENYVVRKVDPDGIITTVAGTGGEYGYSGDGGPAAAAKMDETHGVAVDNSGNIYIADYWNNRVRKVDIDGNISTIAGNGSDSGASGDGGPAVEAVVGRPNGLAVDGSNNLYIVEEYNCRVRKVDAGGTITTVVDDFGETYQYPLPEGAAVDSAGNLYIIDPTYAIIQKVVWELY